MKKQPEWKSLEVQKQEPPPPPRFMARCQKYEGDLKKQSAQYADFLTFFQRHVKFLTGLHHELVEMRSTNAAARLRDDVIQQIKRVRKDIEDSLKHLPSSP